MNTFVRLLFRLITLVLGLSIVIFAFVGGLWYIWQDARGRAPQVGYTITTQKLERLALGVYLDLQGAKVTEPANRHDTREVTFVVQPGQGVGAVAFNLQRMGLVTDAELFRRVVQYWGADQDIEAGVYTLRANMTMEEIMRQLQRGRLPSVTVTIPEGWRAEQIAETLEQLEVTSSQAWLNLVQQGYGMPDYLAVRPAGSASSLEGFLFPDTYQMPRNSPPERILEIMLQNWDRRVPATLRNNAEGLGMTLYEVVTLASIVEREAVVPSERGLIASVYLNRLARGMYLQADPTVQYALGYDPSTKQWWNNLTQQQLQSVDSPYNTYRRGGLPPGPICNPGLAAIKAVLEPTPSEYLYFVHKGDGSHAFGVTFEDHLRNIQLYQNR